MARKSRGFVDDIFEIASRLPWWAGIMLAVLSYFLLHRYAVAEIAVNVKPAQLGQMVTAQLFKALASIGQYLLPFLLLAGAIASFLGSRKRHALFHDAAASRGMESI